MGGIIDINKDRVKCESCESWVDKQEIQGADEDGNQFCKSCCEYEK